MSFHPFKNIQMAPADPILGLNDLFKRDTNSRKINLTMGVFQNAEGVSTVLRSVKQAEKIILEQETSKSYLNIEGQARFANLVRELIFGAEHPLLQAQCCAVAHTPGGTGALKVGADFIRGQLPQADIWISDPSWANHKALFAAAGFQVQTYPYLEAKQGRLDFAGMMQALEKAPEGDVVLLHGCCHNPTGIDPTPAQWEALCELFSRRALLPFIDLAYQGLGEGWDADGFAVRTFGKAGFHMLIASSFSKSFSLYRERTGAVVLVTSSPEQAERALSNLRICVRTNYSSPPSHGGSIVETVLTNEELKKLWSSELDEIRKRVQEMRNLLVDTLQQKMGNKRDFSFLREQKGMFSYTGITGAPVRRLRDEFGIYMLESGRINVAGITLRNVDTLCEAIATVLEA